MTRTCFDRMYIFSLVSWLIHRIVCRVTCVFKEYAIGMQHEVVRAQEAI